MASQKSLIISGFLLLIFNIVVQSAPIEKIDKIDELSNKNDKGLNKHLENLFHSVESSSVSPSTVSQSSLTTTNDKNDHKKKRFINDDEIDSNEFSYTNFDDKNDWTLHVNVDETSAKIHDNADKPVDTDDSKIFSDFRMSTDQLADVVRRRRDVKQFDQLNRRRKRALSPYDFYNTDSFYNPYEDFIERQQYARPIRSFAPIFWYPPVYERAIRSNLAPSFYEPSEFPKLYSTTSENDDVDENPLSTNNDEDEDEDEYNYDTNRYPFLVPVSNNPYDNLQLQQQYNTDDLPIDEEIEQNWNDDDDDDENDDEDDEQYRLFNQNQRPYYTNYGPLETY